MPMKNLNIITNQSDLVELGDNRFKKQILRYGKWSHGAAKDGVLEVTKDKAMRLADNFKRRVIENVPVLRGHHSLQEADSNPHLIAGFVEDVEVNDDGVWAVMNLEDSAVKEVGNKYKNVSAAIDESYEDHETGSFFGDVFRHIALVTEPYIKKLDPNFVALSEGYNILNINQTDMAKDVKLEEEVKDEAEQVETETETEETTEVTEDNTEETAETTEETDEVETEETTDLSETEKELEKAREELAKERAEKAKLKRKNVEAEFDVLLSEGKMIPAMKDEYVALKLTDSTVMLSDESKPVADLIDSLISKMPKMVELGETGTAGKDEVELSEETVDAFKFMYGDKADKKLEAYKEKLRNK